LKKVGHVNGLNDDNDFLEHCAHRLRITTECCNKVKQVECNSTSRQTLCEMLFAVRQ